VAHRSFRTWLLFGHVAAGVALAVVAACSSSSPQPEGCQTNAAECPSPPPSWATDVEAIIHTRCSPCHFDGGAGTLSPYNADYSTYQGVAAHQILIHTVLAACQMPPPDAGQLTTQEKQTLLEWVVCGAPDN
jgi:uncharacterized membrane protein